MKQCRNMKHIANIFFSKECHLMRNTFAKNIHSFYAIDVHRPTYFGFILPHFFFTLFGAYNTTIMNPNDSGDINKTSVR